MRQAIDKFLMDGDFSEEAEAAIVELLATIEELGVLKNLVTTQLSQMGFEKSETLVLVKQTKSKVKVERALQLPPEEFERYFTVTSVKVKPDVDLENNWFTFTPYKSLKRRRK